MIYFLLSKVYAFNHFSGCYSINILKCFIFVKYHILSNLLVKHEQYKPSSWRHFVFGLFYLEAS